MTENVQGTPRRKFIGWTGTALGSAALMRALGPAAGDPDLLDALAQQISPDIQTDTFGFSVTVRRPQDQLLLTLAFFNVDVDFSKSPPTLAKKQNGIDCFLSVLFGTLTDPAPMHVAERAYPLESPLPSQKNAPISQPTTDSPVEEPPVGSRIAGPTRLVYQLPDSLLEPAATTPLTLDSTDLLNWVELILSVVPNAVAPFDRIVNAPPGIGAPRAPSGFETAIELPYNLIISPPARLATAEIDPRVATVFVNAIGPVTHNGWTELWHTRLAARVFAVSGDLGFLKVDETNRNTRTVRAIWCTDPTFENDFSVRNLSDNQIADDKLPFKRTSALRYVDRYDIVRLSSDFTTDANGGPYQRVPDPDSPKPRIGTPFIPSPATVDRLMLTSLGAWLDCDAHWDLVHSTKRKHFNSSLLSWRQRTVQARDSYVRIVRKGYLFPWGHKASLVTVTEREFTADKFGAVGAYLRQKTFIVVAQPVKTYPDGDSVKHAGRNIPFTSVEALTLVTPDLAAPKRYVTKKKHGSYIQTNKESVFEPMLGGAPFKFHFRGTDWAGDPIDMRTPVLWVDDTVAYGDTAAVRTLMDEVFAKWRGTTAKPNYPTVSLHGQRVSVAEPKDPSAAAGDTQLVLSSFQLGVEEPNGASAQHLVDTSQPAFFPALHSAAVQLPQAATISGNTLGATTMAYESAHYLANGFSGNKGGVFFRRANGTTRHTVKFRSDKGGGAVTPNLGVDGISREIGPLSSVDGAGNPTLAGFVQGAFDPAAIFKGVDAKLLGGIELSTILGNVDFGDGDNAQALQLTSVERFNPHRIVTVLDWHPSIQAGGPTIAGQEIDVFVPTGDADNSMDLHAVIISDLEHPANSTSTVLGEIRDFELDLFGSGDEFFIQIPFDSLSFRSESGKKTDVDVVVGTGGVAFKGALSFVQQLADALNFDGSGITVDTSGSAITATLTLAIPTLAVGVFALENLAFSAGVAIPYNGDPVRFDFAFCSRENPFQLEIMIFTGGGFVGLGIGADGVELLEFSFDFGLGFDVDIGVASGQISLTGGVYFECEKADDGGQDIDLTAWVKASGGISALGLVSVSVELYLGLEYQHSSDGSSALAGDAEMSISVHIVFFGFDVGFSVHEEFAGPSTVAATPGGHVAGSRRKALASATPASDLADPATNFKTSMSKDEWAQYCTSFALVGVGV